MPDEPHARGAAPTGRAVALSVAQATAEGAVLAAMLEVGLKLALPWYTSTGLRNVDPHAAWLAPLANAILLLPAVAAAALAAFLTRRPHRAMAWMRVVSYSYAAAQGTLLLSQLHAWAALVLAIGIGSQLARLAERSAWRIGMRAIATGGAVVGLAWSLYLPLSERLRFARSVADLPPARSDAPNVLLLILDTVSAREMSLYGYARQTTPVLDSLAREGVVFDRAIASAPWTLPSHASMFTGRRAIDLPTRYRVPLDGRPRVVAENFAAAGYVTAGFVGNLEYTSRASGLARGFHWYQDYQPSLSSALATTALGERVMRRVARWGGRPVAVGRKQAGEVSAEFLAWEQRVGRRPWFAFLNFYDAHDPYVPPVADERRFLAPGARRVYDLKGVRPTDTAAVASARALHDAALFSLDRTIGAMLDDLRRRGSLEHTIIVVAADHGEEWGGHGVLLHGNSVYLPAIRVPLIIVAPGRVPARLRIHNPVGTRRLARTLADLAGIDSSGLAGTSLASYWTPAASSEGAPQTAVVSWVERAVRQPVEYPASRSALFSVITDSAQVIIGADTAVFDLDDEPDRAVNRRTDPAFRDQIRMAVRTIRPSR